MAGDQQPMIMSTEPPVTEDYVRKEFTKDLTKAYGYFTAVIEDHKLTVDDIPKLTMAAVKVVEKIRALYKIKKPRKSQVKRMMAIVMVKMYISDHYGVEEDSVYSDILKATMKLIPLLIDTIVDAITGNFSIGKTVGRCGRVFGCIHSSEVKYL